MSELHLIIGNRNYSSWSLRPWILLKHLGMQFQTTVLPLDTPEFKGQVARFGPSGRVPILLHGDLCIWESLAICEYLVELAGRGWPHDQAARAVARAVSSEMHAGFSHLRTTWPMNARARDRRTPMTPHLQADIQRIDRLWNDCRARLTSDAGPWLFGEYSVADAMFAPVVLRFNTYGASVSQSSRAYLATVLADAALREWLQAAEQESWRIDASEVG